MFAGRYATPIVVPPGRDHRRRQAAARRVAGDGWLSKSHRVMPLSLTFDHRAATGGEAARFLKAMLDDLALPN